jgi:hypothetical protein
MRVQPMSSDTPERFGLCGVVQDHDCKDLGRLTLLASSARIMSAAMVSQR